MGGQKFQYDESGNTFFYFVLSFLALILAPSTYYLWPRKEADDPSRKKEECRCEQCLVKDGLLRKVEPKKKFKRFVICGLLVFGWLVFFAIGYKVAQFDYEYANFDPYEILKVDAGASQADIKKAYRKWSLVYHPDKETGDEKAFMKLTKAYQALTDEEARKNWERYGNPDGPGAMSFGIALPSWIVEKENSVWVLGLYALVFMVGLPTVVGMWWYKSIRYSGEQVLLGTTQMYYYFFHKTSLVNLKRVVMILAASHEFDRGHNKEIIERASDNWEVPELIQKLPNLSEKNKEYPFCFPYSIKTRALLHAHFSRIPLPKDTLELDRQFVVKKCPYLIQDIVTCVSQLVLLAHAGRVSRLPDLRTIENCMKLSPMIVQALWDKNPLLQLPYVTEDMLRYFITKKRQIRSIQQFVQRKEEERRALLKSLSSGQYNNIMKMCSKLPYIDFQVKSEVVDDEEPSVYTAGAIVTVTVTLYRQNLRKIFGDSQVEQNHFEEHSKDEDETEDDKKKELQIPVVKKPVWQKQAKKGKKGGKKGGGKKPPPKQLQLRAAEEKTSANEDSELQVRKAEHKKAEESSNSESEASGGEFSEEEGKNIHNMVDKESSAEEEEDWDKFQNKIAKKDKALEGKSKVSHSVHCPFFPEDKQEFWWVYVADRKNQRLITAPYLVTDLVDHDEVELRFTAPLSTGFFTYNVCLRSDSYLGFDQVRDIKLDVQEAREVKKHPQWEFSEDEEDKEDEGGHESEFATDDDDSETAD